MKLGEAVDRYLTVRRSQGIPLLNAETTLRCLCKYCGDIFLHELSSEQVSLFVGSACNVAATQLSKFSNVKCFVEYYVLRENIPPLVLKRPPLKRTTRFPFIYTEAQIKALLAAAKLPPPQLCLLDGPTLHTLLLTMYATGATAEEMVSLRQCDLDLEERIIVVGVSSLKRARSLPIGADLSSVLTNYLAFRSYRSDADGFVFRRTDGVRLNRHYLWHRFQRLHESAKIAVSPMRPAPRFIDLRYTFAVHRLTRSIQEGLGLNDLIPALSVYMGYSNLAKAEQFLAYVPERFREDLSKLSPAEAGRKRWREQPDLLNLLASLEDCSSR